MTNGSVSCFTNCSEPQTTQEVTVHVGNHVYECWSEWWWWWRLRWGCSDAMVMRVTQHTSVTPCVHGCRLTRLHVDPNAMVCTEVSVSHSQMWWLAIMISYVESDMVAECCGVKWAAYYGHVRKPSLDGANAQTHCGVWGRLVPLLDMITLLLHWLLRTFLCHTGCSV